jgi:HK97 family phage portal protein
MAGQVVALYPLMPDRMEVCRDGDGEIYYLYTKATDENPKIKEYGTVRLRKENVMHIPGLGFDGLVGYSPIAMAKNAIGMAIACEEFGAKFFANGASPSGVLEHPGTIKDPQRVREAWQSQFGGSQCREGSRPGRRHEVFSHRHFSGPGPVPGNPEVPD